jgi:hypothetical protein
LDVKIPQRHLGEWARDLIEQCEVSRPDRSSQLAGGRNYYYSGSADANEPARYNKIYSHIDRLASFLYSADDIRFSITYDGVLGEPFVERAAAAARVLNRDYHRRGCDLEFADAVHWALVEGKTFIKTVWGHNGLEPWLVHPQFMGVLREDIDGLDRQEAFTHTSYIMPSELDRQIADHPDKDEIKKKLLSASKRTSDADRDPLNDSLRQIVIGGMRPVQMNVAATSKSNVVLSAAPVPNLDPKVAQQLIRVDELWVQDSERDDYTTIRVVEPDIVIEGSFKHRNICGVEGEHPFTEVCPNRLDNYFWGASEIVPLAPLQDMLNRAIEDVTRITRLQADPPKAFIGFTGLTDAKHKALRVPGGFISEDQPNAKVERLAPEVPQELFQQIEKILNWFDEAAGFQPIMMGQGEPGVRAGSHAATLLRTGSPRMRDRALLVERQGGAHGDFCFKLLQNKEAEVYISKLKEHFILKQMPPDYRIAVDSHSGSPVFQDDIERKAAVLSRAGALSPADLIMLTRPPHQDILIEHAEAREKAQAQLMQQHPELLTKGRKSR